MNPHMPSYDDSCFSPPSLVATVSPCHPDREERVADVPMLSDTRAEATLVPQSAMTSRGIVGTLALALSLITSRSAADDRELLINLIENAPGRPRTLECQFEGVFAISNEGMKTLSEDKIYQYFKGHYIFSRTNGEIWSKLTVGYRNRDGQPAPYKVVATVEGQTVIFHDLGNQASAQVSIPSWYDYDEIPGSYVKIFPLYSLGHWLKRPGRRVYQEGSQSLDGHECAVFVCVTGSHDDGPIDENSPYERYFIDLARGGYPLRVEDHRGVAGMGTCIRNVELMQFRAGDQEVWVPVSGRYETYAVLNPDHTFYFGALPTNIQKISVLVDSVKVNETLDKARFRVKVRKGTMVQDHFKNKIYTQGIDSRPAPATRIQTLIRWLENLEDPPRPEAELPADSSSGGAGVLQGAWYYVALAGAVVTLVVWLIIWRRKAR